MNLLKTEPAVILGLVSTIIVGALTQIQASGVVNGNGLQLVGLLITLVPLVISFITRQLVTPAP